MSTSWKDVRKKIQKSVGKILRKQLADRLYPINNVQIISVGIGWEAKEPDKLKVKKLLKFLQDRRVLYHPILWQEEPNITVKSVAEIRKYLVDSVLLETDDDEPLYIVSIELRDACVEFLNISTAMQKNPSGEIEYSQENFRLLRSGINRLRRRFGDLLPVLSDKYEVDLPDGIDELSPISVNYNPFLVEDNYG